MNSRWFKPALDANAAVSERLADASNALVSTLRDANEAIARQGAAGRELVSAFGDEVVTGMRRAGRSTRGLIAERPIESVAIMALIGVGIGWVLRSSRQTRNTPAAARARATTSTRRSPAARKRSTEE
jgi:ElaB/YqjD/DUF883 family membrane-anchored ribosome-binding protein